MSGHIAGSNKGLTDRNGRRNNWSGKNSLFLKESGQKIKSKLEFKRIIKEFIREDLNLEKDKERDSFSGIMDNITMDSGKMEKSMEVAIGNQKKGIFI